MVEHNSIPAGSAPATQAILANYETIEIEELGVDAMYPAAFLRMLRRTGQTLKVEIVPANQPTAPIRDDLPALKPEQVKVYDYLRRNAGAAISSQTLANLVDRSKDTIQNWCREGGVLSAYGVVTAPKNGGYMLPQE